MKAGSLFKLITDAGVDSSVVHIADADYLIPMKDWVFGEFAESFEVLKKNLGQNNYVPQINDCDDFSLLALWYARHLNRLNADKQASIAFGEFHYTRDSGGGHAINFAVTEGGKIVYFEPQISREVFLSESEVFLCSDVRI